LTRFRILLSAWICGSIITAWTAGIGSTALADTSDDASLKQAADKTLSDVQDEKASAKKEKFGLLMKRAKDHRARAEYPQALVAAERALAIYPDDSGAAGLRKHILIDADKSRDALLRAAAEKSGEEAIAGIDRDRIIPANVVTYPDAETWSQVLQRTRQLSAGKGVTGSVVKNWEKVLQDKLDQRISFSFENASLDEVARHITDLTNVGIVIDPKSPIGKAPISLAADAVKLESALNQICRFAEVKWSMADTMIYISDRKVSDDSVLSTYDVTDLIVPVRDFHSKNQRAAAGPSTVGKIREFSFDVSVAKNDDTFSINEQLRHGNELATFVTRNVERGSWSNDIEPGSNANSIQYRNGRLIISAPPKVQEQVLKLLDSFRRARTVQIVVQARFIDIEKNYLEEIGIDWTNLEGGVNTISDQAQSTPTATGDGGTQVKLPIARGFSARGTGTLDEFGLPWRSGYPSTDAESYQGLPSGYDAIYGTIPDGWGRNPEPNSFQRNGEPVSASRPGGPFDMGMANVNNLGVTLGDPATGFDNSGGLLLDLAYLSSFQVRALLQAVEKHRKGNVLIAPKLTCFNGERANIAVTNQISYVRNVVDGMPEIGILTDGIVFEVAPYASADRRYVTMEILPTMRSVRRPIPQQTIRTPMVTDDDYLIYLTSEVQLPEVTVRSVETFASVPDGGTLLLGGLSRAREVKGRAGVPIIDDIPIIKYLFSRWGKSDTRTSLIILVRADILIQGEQEPVVGPSS